jgi:hypothetical protein
MLSLSAAIPSGSNRFRGWSGFGPIRAAGISIAIG